MSTIHSGATGRGPRAIATGTAPETVRGPPVRKLRGGQIPPEILAVAEALRIDDAARLFGISRSTIYNLLNAGLLPSARLGGRRVIARADLLALLHPELTALAKK